MRILKVGASMDLQGCKLEEEIEVDDDATSEEIEIEVREWALEKFEWWWSEKEKL